MNEPYNSQLKPSSLINKITSLVILDIKPTQGKSNLNIAIAHLNIFIAMKKTASTLKSITEKKIIDTEMQFLKEEDYIKVFMKLFKDNEVAENDHFRFFLPNIYKSKYCYIFNILHLKIYLNCYKC